MTEDTFLCALHENPGDEVTWLALADWLEEQGQPQRAELVRLVRRLRDEPVMRRGKERAEMEDRVAALLASGVRPVVPELVNSIGMRLALIPAGRFRMGSPKSEKGRDPDEDAHEVELTRPFYMSVFTVTQAQYQTIMGTNPSHFRPEGGGEEMVTGLDTRDYPAEWMTYGEARTFCRRLSALPAEKKAKRKYRIPTEAEWEYACRGGATSTQPFHVGATLAATFANFDGEYPYGKADEGGYLRRPCPVGLYPPNVFGLHDMHGNIHEWCSDWYDGDYYTISPRTDPQGPSGGSSRVQRGGCWRCSGRLCRAAARASDRPGVRDLNAGFRVVCTKG